MNFDTIIITENNIIHNNQRTAKARVRMHALIERPHPLIIVCSVKK